MSIKVWSTLCGILVLGSLIWMSTQNKPVVALAVAAIAAFCGCMALIEYEDSL